MRFHLYKQLDSRDCGPACICMISSFFGRKISLAEVRKNSYITRTGVNLLGLSEAAQYYGFRTVGLRLSLSSLKKHCRLPCILHWNQNHFVVLYKIKNNKYYIADPAYGMMKYSEQNICTHWIGNSNSNNDKGILLLLEPSPAFYEKDISQSNKMSLLYILKYLRNYKSLFVQLVFGLLIGSLLQLVFPFLTQSIVDQGIGLKDLGFIQVILIAQLMLVVSRNLVDVIRRWILLHISTRVSVSLISDFLLKLMKLPMFFFDSKLVGDLIRRIEDHKRIEIFLTQSIMNIIFATLTIVVFGITLIVYNTRIFVIFIIGSILYFAWVMLFMKKRAVLDHENFSQMSENQNVLIQLIYGMQEIKLTGCEQQKLWEWENIQANLFENKKKSLTLGQWQSTGATLINEITNVLITITSATAVISGDITLGGMLSIQYIIGQLHGPIEQYISFIQQSQDARLSLERMGEIQNTDEEDNKTFSFALIPINDAIRIENISFSYGSVQSGLVINNLSLCIPSGKITAIVGLSGSGKTTLIKLLLGFYSPLNGTMKIGNMSLNEVSLKEWRKHCGVVMQDGYIFNDTIAGNIAPDAEEINEEKLLYAVKMANLQEYVESLPQKLDTKIGNTGRGLSQGQRQRLLIARAIYKNPEYLFFDEATNALDANNESIIMHNLNLFFQNKTVVIVAHRLSTVKNADQIVVMRDGSIVEIGNHKELINMRKMYYNLVKDQLALDS